MSFIIYNCYNYLAVYFKDKENEMEASVRKEIYDKENTISNIITIMIIALIILL